ncbi:hypothetical protein GJ744_004622 [Endocarpon pusillum]|uniref:Uncharacterized protein n=1 Tax=Endocarpon pusillum TaxID=364733 RepID=A0A8H7ALQ1_9EURO|nr:hypothetical protein GJ744_004622 [Endocarpon pusillum]
MQSVDVFSILFLRRRRTRRYSISRTSIFEEEPLAWSVSRNHLRARPLLPYPQYPSYAPPYPAYYLAPNPVPAFQEPYPLLPPGARVLSPPRAATADELKYKCSICGRFRSPRFHYKHPIPPGQLPAQTVCRKCRQAGTDSEDTSDDKARPRRSRSIVSISQPIRTRVVSDGDGRFLRRRSSRVDFIPRSRSRHRGRLRRRSISSSSSLDTDEVDIFVDDRPKRARSRSVGTIVERIRYIEEEPPLRVSPTRETIYIKDNRDLRRPRASRYEEDYYYTEYDSEEDYIPIRRIIARAPSVSRISRQQCSEPFIREHVRVRTRDFFDGPNSVYEESRVVERPARPPLTLPSDVHVLRVPADEAQRIKERLANSDEYELVADRPILRADRRDYDWYEDEPRHSRRGRRRRRRSRSRVSFADDIENGKNKAAARIPEHAPRHRNLRSSEFVETPRILPQVRAPTPPPADRRRSGRHSLASRLEQDDVEVRRTSQHDAADHRGRPTTGGRRATPGSRSGSGSRWNAPFGGRPPMTEDETIEMQQRIHTPPANEDYDWYDSHGQRVRVREI